MLHGDESTCMVGTINFLDVRHRCVLVAHYKDDLIGTIGYCFVLELPETQGCG